MTFITIAILGIGGLLAFSAIWALGWAVSTGQMQQCAHGATSIFDDEEPIGLMTDGFPTSRRHVKSGLQLPTRDGDTT